MSGPSSIANVFAEKLQTLLNSHSSNINTRDQHLSPLEERDLLSFSFSLEDVSSALGHLKSGKSDGSPISSNHFINASSALVSVLSPLFTALVRHAFLPGDLKNCVFKPIPKPSKDPASSDSYRPIALAPILSKILEWCILLQFSEFFYNISFTVWF